MKGITGMRYCFTAPNGTIVCVDCKTIEIFPGGMTIDGRRFDHDQFQLVNGVWADLTVFMKIEEVVR